MVMKDQVLPVQCPCPDENIAVVVNAFNEAKARCLDCGDEGILTVIEGPKDFLT